MNTQKIASKGSAMPEELRKQLEQYRKLDKDKAEALCRDLRELHAHKYLANIFI